MNFEEPLIFEVSRPGRRGASLPKSPDRPKTPPESLRRKKLPRLPEVSEPEVIRHFTRLSQWN